jgi:flagellar motor switch protein FliN
MGLHVSVLQDLTVDLSVVLGRRRMPIHMLLRMGRGAVIELEATESDLVEILANDHPIARGQLVVTGNRISVEITELIRKATVVREPGTTIGEGHASLIESMLGA